MGIQGGYSITRDCVVCAVFVFLSHHLFFLTHRVFYVCVYTYIHTHITMEFYVTTVFSMRGVSYSYCYIDYIMYAMSRHVYVPIFACSFPLCFGCHRGVCAEVVLPAVAQNGNAFGYAARLLRNDPNIAFQAAQCAVATPKKMPHRFWVN